MSHFYGYLTGNRGTTTRAGTKNSGITAQIKSWKNKVYATLKDNNGEDILVLNIPIGLKVVLNNLEMTEEDFKLLQENTEIFKEILDKLKVIKGLK